MTTARSTAARIANARSTLSRLATSYSERAVRPVADAVQLALAADGTERASALLDSVDRYAEALAEAEGQLSRLERSVRTDLDAAGTLMNVRTDAHLSSAFELSTATAAVRAILLDVDAARAAGVQHDPVDLLVLLGEADEEIDTALRGYRPPSDQARRQLAAIESARLCARVRIEGTAILIAAHPEAVSDAARDLLSQAREQLADAEARAASEPAAALDTVRAAQGHAGSALDSALLDLSTASAPEADERRSPRPLPG